VVQQADIGFEESGDIIVDVQVSPMNLLKESEPSPLDGCPGSQQTHVPVSRSCTKKKEKE
jgi:hypothetical protein